MAVSPASMDGSQAGGPAKGWTRTVMGVCRLTTVAIPVPIALYRLPTAWVATEALRGTCAGAGLGTRADTNNATPTPFIHLLIFCFRSAVFPRLDAVLAA